MKFFEELKEASAKDQSLDWANLCYYWQKNEEVGLLSEGEDRIVFMGDSITEQWGELYPEFFRHRSYINRGIGGQTTPQMLLRFKQDVINLNPTKVVLLAGTNDIAGNTGPSNVKMIIDNIVSMSELAVSNNISMIISSILPVFNYPWADHIANVPDTIEKINKELEQYAQRHEPGYLDYFSFLVDENRGLKNEYTTDGVHLNRDGYKVISQLANERLGKKSF